MGLTVGAIRQCVQDLSDIRRRLPADHQSLDEMSTPVGNVLRAADARA